MLDISDDQSLMRLAWDKVELKPDLPDGDERLLRPARHAAARPGCRRAYHRFYLRGKGDPAAPAKRTWACTRPTPRGKDCVSCRRSSCYRKSGAASACRRPKIFRSKSSAAAESAKTATSAARCSSWRT